MRAFNDVAPYTHLVDEDAGPPAVVLRDRRRDGVRRVRRRPGRRRRRRGRHGRVVGRHQRRATPPSRWCCRSRSTTRSYLGDSPADIARGEGRDHQARARSPCSPSRRPRSPRCCSGAPPRSARPSPARAWSSASSSRVPAVGGQMLSLQGLRGAVRRGLPAAVRRPPGAERRGRAGRGRGVRGRAAARRGAGARGVRRGHLARPARDHPAQPDDRARRRAQPARRRGARPPRSRTPSRSRR